MNRDAMEGLLTPAQYDAAEAASRLRVTNRVIEAFCPAAFNFTAYPVHVEDERELWRYVDVMHEEHSLDATVNGLLGGLTYDEFELFKRAVNFMVAFTTARFGRAMHCQNALLRMLNVFRYIKAANPRVVMELGPGSGYLGLLCILDGIGLVGCDNTQAFYLEQSHLWQAAAGKDNFIELALGEESLRDALSRDLSGKVLHVPWWKIVDLDPQTLPGGVDIVTANHCLAEMNANARKYFLRLSHGLLRNSGGPFLFEGWGATYMNTVEGVTRNFIKAGFSMCHHEKKVTVFAPSQVAGSAVPKLPRKVPPHRRAQNLLRLIVSVPRVEYGYYVAGFEGENKYSRLVRDVQQKHAAAAKIDLKEIETFVRGVYGSHPSYDEERFLAMLQEN